VQRQLVTRAVLIRWEARLVGWPAVTLERCPRPVYIDPPVVAVSTEVCRQPGLRRSRLGPQRPVKPLRKSGLSSPIRAVDDRHILRDCI
jgi:hypothetical protein